MKKALVVIIFTCVFLPVWAQEVNAQAVVRPQLNVGFGFGFGQDLAGIELNLQAGASVSRFSFLLDMFGGALLDDRSTSTAFDFLYSLGVLAEAEFYNMFIFGLGGGFGGTAVSAESYPYIRASAAISLLEIVKIAPYADFNFDYGFRFGFNILFYCL